VRYLAVIFLLVAIAACGKREPDGGNPGALKEARDRSILNHFEAIREHQANIGPADWCGAKLASETEPGRVEVASIHYKNALDSLEKSSVLKSRIAPGRMTPGRG
jgi:hypothetical protein